MTGLINRRGLGTQPQGVTPRRGGGGGGGNRGAQPNRGGGGGGGGGGNRLPNTGLYQGRAGEAQANLNPEAFFSQAVSNVGGLSYSGTPISEFSDDFIAKLIADYNAAMAGNQRLSPVDWLRDTYGAGWEGKKGRDFNPGTLGLSGGALDTAYTNYYSNTNTADYLTGQAVKQGGYVPGGGNQGFQDWFQTSYIPGVLADIAGERATNPKMSVAEMMAERDMMGDARKRYLNRPGSQRQLGPVNLGARWSWWE